jgi:tetratricopeptide (TPR) repeat protein
MVTPPLMRAAALIFLVLILGTTGSGCSGSSEWDQQWEEVEEAIHEGRIQEAKARLNGLLTVLQQDGSGDYRHAQVIVRLGEIARMEGDDKKAEAYFWEALPLFAQSVGPEHPSMAETLLAIGVLYEHKGQEDIALPLVKRAVAIQEKTWGFSDPRLLPGLERYHTLLTALNRENEQRDIQSRITSLRQAK